MSCVKNGYNLTVVLFLKEPLICQSIHKSLLSRSTPTPEPLNDPSTAIVGAYKEKEQCMELGFVEKLVELWTLRETFWKQKQKFLFQVFSQIHIQSRRNHDE